MDAVSSQSPANEELMESVTKVKTTLSKAYSSSWKVDETEMIGHENLRSVYFLDAIHGWVGGKRVLYRTSDAGKTWLSVDIGLAENASVSQVVFLNATTGWIVAQEEASSPLKYQENRFWLMQTKDGGQTWRTQLEGQDSVLNRIRFVNEGEGWLVGMKYTNLVPLRAHHFIFHTLDLGEHWVDVSEPLNQMLVEMPLKPGFTDVMPEGLSTVRVLMPGGSIFKTEDGGRNWRLLNGTIDDSTYACSCLIGLTEDKRLWVGGEKDDSHSVLGMVAVKDGGSWKEYLLGSVSFSDILFLSRQRVLTSGSTTPNQREYIEKRQAVITYSSDGGTTWSFVYRNQNASKISALALVDSDHIWAVGDAGLLLRLTATTVTN
jgi:photosystem II stability/assembly factor-like uncharacterized protein